MVQEVEEHLAIGEALYWESGVDLEQPSPEKQEGTPRRSRRGTKEIIFGAFFLRNTLHLVMPQGAFGGL